MRFGSIRTDILLGVIQEELDAFKAGDVSAATFPRSLDAVTSEFPSLSSKERVELLRLVLTALTCNVEEKVELVVTAPPSFAIRNKVTKIAVDDMLNRAQKSILITGYSLSEYFSDMIERIIQKSQQGVFVKFYVNNIESQKCFDRLLKYQGRFLQIYNYPKQQDSMSALHAKVISVDQQETLITSANLSYHGQEGNIELGTYIISKDIATQVERLFTQLIFSKVFEEYRDD